MKKLLLEKAGPIAGILVSLATTGVAGYKVFASPSTGVQEVPSVPTPTEASQEQEAQIIYDDVYVTATPSPSATNVDVSTGASGVLPTAVTVTGRSGFDFEDNDDHVEFEHEDNEKEEHKKEHEKAEPTESPVPTEAPEH